MVKTADCSTRAPDLTFPSKAASATPQLLPSSVKSQEHLPYVCLLKVKWDLHMLHFRPVGGACWPFSSCQLRVGLKDRHPSFWGWETWLTKPTLGEYSFFFQLSLGKSAACPVWVLRVWRVWTCGCIGRGIQVAIKIHLWLSAFEIFREGGTGTEKF